MDELKKKEKELKEKELEVERLERERERIIKEANKNHEVDFKKTMRDLKNWNNKDKS